MNQRKPPPSLEDLDARLRKARGDTPAAGQAEGADRKAPMSGLGLALRIGVELVAPLAVGRQADIHVRDRLGFWRRVCRIAAQPIIHSR